MEMAKIFLVFVLIAVVECTHKHHPKFRLDKTYNDTPLTKQVPCSEENEQARNEIIAKSICGEPKEVFVHLKPPSTLEQVTPSAVWVKRCVGLCDYDTPGSKCVPTETAIKPIPIRIYNVKTGKDYCSMYQLEEHVSCACLCGQNLPERPRKSNQCPNIEERRSCLQQRSKHMRWNRSKCTCEQRKRRIQ